MNTLEVGAPKKSNWLKWALVLAALLIALVTIQVASAFANDQRKKPLNLTAEQAAGKCIGEVQLAYQAKGLHAVGRTEDFTVTGNSSGQMGVAGKVTIVDSTGGTVRDVNCLIEVISSGGTTTTSYRIH